jgi:hypothetical protein
MTRRTGIGRYLAIFALGCISLAVAATALPHDPYVRWQSLRGTMFEPAGYYFERLHFDPAPVDVVFIGSSRTETGVSAPLLEGDLARRGLPLRVANLSLPAAGMDIRVVEAREALRARPDTKLLVISVVESLPRDGHQAFGEIATTADIFGSPWLVNRTLPANVLRLPMRQIKLWAATAMPEAFGYPPRFDPSRYPGSAIDYRGLPGWKPVEPTWPYGSAQHAADLAAESDRRKRGMTRPLLPAGMADVEYGVSRGSIEAIARLARANGTKLVFLYLPFYRGYDRPTDTEWLRRYGPIWSPGWMRFDPRNFRDAAHPSPSVLPRLNAWLAGKITEELAAPSNGAVP